MYEIEFSTSSRGNLRMRSTMPVFEMEQELGVGDAWALVHAADQAWDGHSGEWVDLVGGKDAPSEGEK